MPTRTDTPLPTDMPEPIIVVPTDTPAVTDTPSPTDTLVPTDTPIPPTSTPLPTDTLVPPTATAMPTPTQQAQPAAEVEIRYIFYDGIVPTVESDEYAEIVNQGTAPVNLAGWRLNAGAPGQDFVFPSFVLEPGQTCRVYTNEVHPETGGFSFNSSSAVWRNKGDCGYLHDASGALISEYCY